METNILIVGGGLAGLALARQLHRTTIDYRLVEARSRLGGRIATQYVPSKEGETAYFDMGPAWFWPGQPRMEKLVQDLGLTPFLQYADGELSFEDEAGKVFRGRGYASMAGSFRLEGGLATLVEGIQQQLDPEHLSLALKVTEIQQLTEPQSTGKIVATCVDASNHRQTISCNRVVLALPPRVAAETIQFSPALSPSAIKAMQDIATWMAGQAKIVAVYDRPFWREAGLSGDAMSRRGPMVEIHDASPAQGGPYGLFGFVGVPAIARQQNVDSLRQAALEQLERLFGAKALNPLELILKDWACDPETATKLDFQPQYTHPAYGLPHGLSNLWDGRLMLGSTEVAANFGGYLEGALEASEMVYASIVDAC